MCRCYLIFGVLPQFKKVEKLIALVGWLVGWLLAVRPLIRPCRLNYSEATLFR